MRIVVDKKTKELLSRTFGVSLRLIDYALCYDTKHGQSDKAAKIRIVARMHGGRLEMTAPACETIHCSDGTMEQFFDNGCTIIADKTTGKVLLISPDNKLVDLRKNATVTELMSMQERAKIYSGGLLKDVSGKRLEELRNK